jgi:hypothetical protein
VRHQPVGRLRVIGFDSRRLHQIPSQRQVVTRAVLSSRDAGGTSTSGVSWTEISSQGASSVF